MRCDMQEMSLAHRQTFIKTIQVLTNFIQKRRYSKFADNIKLRIITPAGEEKEIFTAAEAEECKEQIQKVLDLERLYSK